MLNVMKVAVINYLCALMLFHECICTHRMMKPFFVNSIKEKQFCYLLLVILAPKQSANPSVFWFHISQVLMI